MQKELGSSPRGRGKLFTKVPVPAIMGLIPAWAGKTDWRTFESMRRRAHPRVGGENLSRPRGWGKSPGSSPRGRGKPHGARSGIPRDGLIPAWAGKTSSSASPRPPSRAHPRVGGENGNGPTAGNPMYGSSPRGRGKLILPCELRYMFGLIPAWAGKTWRSWCQWCWWGAHPRVGVENCLAFACCSLTTWLIPAWAGKTRATAGQSWRRPAHPRVGGENSPLHLTPSEVQGSSPRGRGKHGGVKPLDGECGLIPAWAGKTFLDALAKPSERAHPRVGGENWQQAGKTLDVLGLIPAWAGKTTLAMTGRSVAAAHPRVGGENPTLARTLKCGCGSSPRGRGKRHDEPIGLITDGLIPAWAGKTWRRRACWRPVPAHPRVGGENGGAPSVATSNVGSSPRGRGKPPTQTRDGSGTRLIPAWAGKTKS